MDDGDDRTQGTTVPEAVQALAADPPDLGDRRVVCLADYFVDHFVEVPDPEALLDAVRDVAASGGGNVPGVRQALFPGGQSANVARFLAGLGCGAALVAPTGPEGRLLAGHWLGSLGVDLSGVVEGRNSLTVALEAPDANVMLNSAADLADVTLDGLGGPGVLDGADLVVLANWAQVADGDALVADVLHAAADRGRPVLLDPGDPRRRDGDHRLDEVLSEAADAGTGPWLVSVNEAEAEAFGWTTGEAAADSGSAPPFPVVVHTAADATLVRPDGDPVTVPALDVDPLRRTGAGDAFNAGLAVAHLLDLEDRDSLHLAHAVAAAAITADGFVVGWRDVRRVVGSAGPGPRGPKDNP